MVNQRLAQLETLPMGESQPLTVLMILMIQDSACRQELSPEKLHPSGDGNTCQTSGRGWEVLWKSRGQRIERAGGGEDTTKRLTESTNLGPWGLTENETPTKEHAGAASLPPFVAEVLLGLHVGLVIIGAICCLSLCLLPLSELPGGI